MPPYINGVYQSEGGGDMVKKKKAKRKVKKKAKKRVKKKVKRKAKKKAKKKVKKKAKKRGGVHYTITKKNMDLMVSAFADLHKAVAKIMKAKKEFRRTALKV